MVCLGNICRSPLAEGILRHKIQQRNLDWTVDSAGTGGWHAGELPDTRSIAIARRHGIDITDQRARKFQVADFERFDHIFVMDRMNLRDVLGLAQTDAQREKVARLLEYAPHGESIDVPDPYYDNGFEAVFQMLDRACDALLRELA